MQYFFMAGLSGITETDAFECDSLLWSWREWMWRGRFRHTGRNLKILEDPVKQGQSAEQGPIGSPQRRCRRGKLGQGRGQGGKASPPELGGCYGDPHRGIETAR